MMLLPCPWSVRSAARSCSAVATVATVQLRAVTLRTSAPQLAPSNNLLYDSQSGQYIELDERVRLHDLAPLSSSATSELLGKIGKSGISSVALPSSTSLQAAQLGRSMPFRLVELHALASEAAAEAGGGGVVLSLRVEEGSEVPEREAAREATRAAKGRGLPVRVVIEHAFTLPDGGGPTDPMMVQLVASELADEGADVITLCDAAGQADAESLRDVVEAVVWTDVEGTPMTHRVGLRAAPTAEGVELCRLAAAPPCKLKHFDVCSHGERAPTPSQLVEIFDSLGLEHGVRSGALP